MPGNRHRNLRSACWATAGCSADSAAATSSLACSHDDRGTWVWGTAAICRHEGRLIPGRTSTDLSPPVPVDSGDRGHVNTWANRPEYSSTCGARKPHSDLFETILLERHTITRNGEFELVDAHVTTTLPPLTRAGTPGRSGFAGSRSVPSPEELEGSGLSDGPTSSRPATRLSSPAARYGSTSAPTPREPPRAEPAAPPPQSSTPSGREGRRRTPG